MKIVKLKLADLESNIGQIPDLPMNPRQWTQSDIDALAVSLEETPELFEARPLIVVPHDGKYVILGGNLRYEASKKNQAKEVPCIIFPAETPIEKLKELVIKDNGSFGAWDYDSLANEWGDLPLDSWGVPAWNPEKVDEGAVDALFQQSGEGAAAKPLQVSVEVPASYEDKLEDIKEALLVTLEAWPGCSVK